MGIVDTRYYKFIRNNSYHIFTNIENIDDNKYIGNSVDTNGNVAEYTSPLLPIEVKTAYIAGSIPGLKNAEKYCFKAFIKNNDTGKGVWLQFPTDRDTVSRTFEVIGLPANAENSDYSFGEYVYHWDENDLHFPQNADINELNELAKQLDGLDDYETETFLRATDAAEHTRDTADLINLAYNTECYNIVYDMYSWAEIGEHFAEKSGLGKEDIGELAEYVDYEAYGKDYAEKNGGYFLGDVFLETNCADFTIKYDGYLESLPIESVVTESELAARNIYELEDAMRLSIILDNCFREYSEEYADVYPDATEQQESLCDSLTMRETVHIKDLLKKLDLPEDNTCMQDIINFENKYPKDTFSLYQLKDGPDLHYHRFVSLEQLHKDGSEVERNNYDLVYIAALTEKDTPENIFTRFNTERNRHFMGHSMSVSDVLVIHKDGEDKAYYCDKIGFAEVPQFFKEKARDQERGNKKPSIKVQLKIMARLKDGRGKTDSEPKRKPPEIGG